MREVPYVVCSLREKIKDIPLAPKFDQIFHTVKNLDPWSFYFNRCILHE